MEKVASHFLNHLQYPKTFCTSFESIICVDILCAFCMQEHEFLASCLCFPRSRFNGIHNSLNEQLYTTGLAKTSGRIQRFSKPYV